MLTSLLLTVHSHHIRIVQVGMPEVNDLVGATLNYKLKVAQGNVRKFLASATEGVQLGQYSDVVDKILAAVDEIEKKTGAPLDEANKEGWKALTTKVEVREAHMSAGYTCGTDTQLSFRPLTIRCASSSVHLWHLHGHRMHMYARQRCLSGSDSWEDIVTQLFAFAAYSPTCSQQELHDRPYSSA